MECGEEKERRTRGYSGSAEAGVGWEFDPELLGKPLESFKQRDDQIGTLRIFPAAMWRTDCRGS